MVCFQCGNPVSTQAKACPNCGAALRSPRKRLNEGGSQGLRRMTMELKAINVSGQFFPPGELVAGRFRVGEMIGEGPFGQVFKAHDTLADTDVALKVFAPDVLRNPMDQERFLNATRSARALTQRNVVRLHDSGVHKDHAWVSMQHLEGLNLRKLLDLRKIKNEGFSLEEIEPIIGQITLALQHISRECPHGNLKPENIIFLPDFIKVTDSFIFPALSGEVFRERLEKSPYLAPELRQNSDIFDARCDVYSVGKIIGEMYYGDVDAGGSIERNSGLDALYERATAADVSARYASVEELAEDLGTLLDTGMLLQMRRHGAPVPPPPAPPTPVLAVDAEPHSLPPAPPAFSEIPAGVEADKAIPEEEIATIEVRRSSGDLPPMPGSVSDSSAEPSLGDLLDTIEADRTQMPTHLTTPERLETRQPAGRITTVVEPASSAGAKKTSSGVPLALIVIFAVVAVAIFAIVMLQQPDNEVVTLGDGTASTSQARENQANEENEEKGAAQEELSQALVAAKDIVAESAVKLEETENKAPDNDKVEAASASEPAASAVTAESGKDAAGISAEASKNIGASSSASSSAAPTGAPARESAAKEAVPAKKDAAPPKETAPQAPTRAPVVAEAPKAQPGQGLDCPAGMVLIKNRNGNYCVDAFEFPGKGATPRTNTTWFEARKQCVNQNKRLCSLGEWKQACGAQYPYGSKFNADSCNTADEDGFERSLAKAGSFPACRSRSGAFDMSGNVHEWVEEQRVAGGGFDSDESVASCGYSSPKAAGSSSGSIGFRCCVDAQ